MVGGGRRQVGDAVGGLLRLKRFVMLDFPRAVRAQAGYVWAASALLYLPAILVGWLVYERPDLILSVTSAENAAQFEEMYSDSADSIGRLRDAETDWFMFGYYIWNNIGIAFQCFAAGIFLGSAAEARLRANALAGTLDDYELSFEDGEKLRGRFLLQRLDYSGDFNGERNYTLQLESSGQVVPA